MSNPEQAAARFRDDFQRLHDEIAKVIVGGEPVIDGVLTCLFAGGHCLLEGVPGLGKTLLVRTLSEALELQFSRIQFTPDLMPADIIGTNIVVEDESGNREFRFRAKDGHEIIGLFSTQMILLAGEDCLLSSINDITERQRATERLRESESRLATALDIARAGYWEYDAVTDVFTFNDAFYRVYKTTAAQAGGYRMPSAEYARRFCHPDDADIVAREIAAAMACAEKGFSRQF